MAIPLHQERMRGKPSPERDCAYEDIHGRRDQYDTGAQDGVAGSEHEGFSDSSAGMADRAMLLQGRSPGKAPYGSASLYAPLKGPIPKKAQSPTTGTRTAARTHTLCAKRANELK